MKSILFCLLPSQDSLLQDSLLPDVKKKVIEFADFFVDVFGDKISWFH